MSTNLTLNANITTTIGLYLVPVNELVEYFISLFGYYITPALSFISALTNLSIFCALFLQHHKKRRISMFIQAKFFFSFILGTLACGFQNDTCTVCTSYVHNTLSMQIYRIFFLKIAIGAIRIVSSLIEMSLAYSQFCIEVRKRENYFTKIHPHLLVFGYTLVAVGVSTPEIFAYDITRADATGDLYTISANNFGSTKLFVICSTIRKVLENFGVIVVLGYLTSKLVSSTKKSVKLFVNDEMPQFNPKKMRQLNKLKRQWLSSQVVIALNFSFILSHLGLFVGQLLEQYDLMVQKKYSLITSVYRSMTYSVVMAIMLANPVVYYYFIRKLHRIKK